MSTLSEFQTLLLIEEEEKSWIEFTKTSPGKDRLPDLQKLLNYLEDISTARLIIFRNLDLFSQYLNSVDEFRYWEKVIERLNRLPIITIAIIDGACFGVSLQIALACDFRLASIGSTLQSSEVKQGYLPGMIIFRLAKFVGLGVAKRILFMGLPYKVEDAFQVGLIEMVFSVNEEATAVNEFIKLLLPVQPTAIQLTRRLLDESFASSYDETVGHFIAAQYKCMN
ncbi:enoyl-CoA hydratase/isomerase family protein [Mucilaginibacter sp. RCC_168]|uniref:enoyl-CoA hydratase/isomerase family protein n=1 Tax=Mucilaginibacter sp. RCC_168 TaxID=3239221 RepID=UPI0035235A9D